MFFGHYVKKNYSCSKRGRVYSICASSGPTNTHFYFASCVIYLRTYVRTYVPLCADLRGALNRPDLVEQFDRFFPRIDPLEQQIVALNDHHFVGRAHLGRAKLCVITSFGFVRKCVFLYLQL